MREKFSMISDTNNMLIEHTKVRICNAQVFKSISFSNSRNSKRVREMYMKEQSSSTNVLGIFIINCKSRYQLRTAFRSNCSSIKSYGIVTIFTILLSSANRKSL